MALAIAALVLSAVPTQAAVPAPAWSVRSLAVPTNFTAGNATGSDFYEVTIQNSGGAATDGSPVIVSDELAPGLGVKGIDLNLRTKAGIEDLAASYCGTETSGEVVTVKCTIPTLLPDGSQASLLGPSEAIRMVIRVTMPASPPGHLLNKATVSGGGGPSDAVTIEHPAISFPAGSGFEEFEVALLGADGMPETQAGAHPDQFTMNFAVNTKATPAGTKAPFVPAGGDIKDVDIDLPPGLVGNLTAVDQCTPQQFNNSHTVNLPGGAFYTANDCPDGSAIGLAVVQQVEGAGSVLPVPLYSLTPPKGMPAQFGFQVLTASFYVDTKVRTGSDYGITAFVTNTTEAKRVTAFAATIWGTPADPRHNPQRGGCLNPVEDFPFANGTCPSGISPVKPFMRLPTSCLSPLPISMTFNTWSSQSVFTSATSTSPTPIGCGSLPFEPTLELQPTTTVSDSPSGLAAHLHLPQDQVPSEPGTADLKKAVVTLPKGLVVNPSGANGLEACSAAQIGLTTANGVAAARFTVASPSCPNAAKIGSVEVKTPLVEQTLPGSVYVATPRENPFDSLLALYLVVDDPQSGIVVKLPGRVSADPQTGQLTTVFDESPQVPFEDFELDFFGGPRAALRTPATCGTFAASSVMTPHSAPEGLPVTSTDSIAITQAPNGGACAQSESALPNSPAFSAGTTAPVAGAFAPMILNLSREDGSQEFSSVSVSPPPGLIGRLAGIPACSDAALAAAAAKSGRAEAANASCPSASEVGTVTVAAGAGPAPYYTQGRAYLAGPYKGAPISLAIVTPATAGPYDLGAVVVRAALFVDPETARVTATSDPIPRILEGIPLDVRKVSVTIDRPNFILNPTNCNPLAFGGQVFSVLGQAASLTERFQVGECQRLGFRPKLALRLFGGTKRSDHPRLRAVLQVPAGNANIARVSVALPHSEFLDQGSIGTICTRVQFAANACPKRSVYGKVSATSPLVDYTLTGPVYLRSNPEHELPDLVAVVKGPAEQPIEVASAGIIDSINGGIRTTFTAFPDAPITKVVLNMRGGKKKGLLENSRDICRHTNRATVRFVAQNGRKSDFRPVLAAKCKGKSKEG